MELLAPAGTKESLIAAVENGADAVYLGGKLFNARRFAANFNEEELCWAVKYCHVRGVKVYVTVNTLIHEHELEPVVDYIFSLYNLGVDAVIVQDLGLAHLIHSILPDFELHASTQMFLHNRFGIKFAEKLGIKRAILARELSLDEIAELAESGLDLEVFVHGALCVAYSGQCLFSSLLGGRSGNRGQCAQPCRLPYQLVDRVSQAEVVEQPGDYLISPKDLRLIEHLDLLERIGVKSLKIEGRMKGPEYTAVVTRTYRDAIDRRRFDHKALTSVFNREFTTHHLFDKQGRNLIRWNPLPHEQNDDIIRSAQDSYRSPKAFRKIPAALFASLAVDEPLKLTLIDNHGTTAYQESELVGEAAEKRPLTKETLKKQLLRFGNDPIKIDSLEIELGENVILPLSEVNRTRRLLVEKWEQARLSTYPMRTVTKEQFVAEKQLAFTAEPPQLKSGSIEPILAVSVTDFEAAQAALDAGADLIYYYGTIYTHHKDFLRDLSQVTAAARRLGAQCFAAVERVTDDDELEHFSNLLDQHQYDGVLVGNIGALKMMLNRRQQHESLKVHGDWSLNIFNSITASYLGSKDLSAFYLSTELNYSQIKAISVKTKHPLGVVVHGQLPLMVSKYCPIGACMDCIKDGGREAFPCMKRKYGLRDRKGYILPVEVDRRCRMHLFNPIDLCLIDQLEQLVEVGIKLFRIEAKGRDPHWISAVVSSYFAKLNGGSSSENELLPYSSAGTYTKGHFHRGVK